MDGTVIDTVVLIRESHRHAVRTVLNDEFSDERLVANVGRPLIDQMRAFSPEKADELLQVYREWNHAHTKELIAAYEGMDELLAALRDAGATLGVVTSKSLPTVQLAFDVLPLGRHFSVLIAAEDTERHKPDPAPLMLALQRAGGDPSRACYIGDAPFDMEAGKAAGLTTIGVTWGFFPKSALEPYEPDHIVDTCGDLAALLMMQ